MYILKKKLVHVNSNRLTVKMEGCVADCVFVMGGGVDRNWFNFQMYFSGQISIFNQKRLILQSFWKEWFLNNCFQLFQDVLPFLNNSSNFKLENIHFFPQCHCIFLFNQKLVLRHNIYAFSDITLVYSIFWFHTVIIPIKFMMAAVRHLEMGVERVSGQNLLAIALRNICAKGDICTMILS